MKPQHDNSFISKDLDCEFSLHSLTPPLSCFCPSCSSTPPAVTSFAYFCLFLPQNVTVLSLYKPHSANLEGRESGRENERGRGLLCGDSVLLPFTFICDYATCAHCGPSSSAVPPQCPTKTHGITTTFQMERIKMMQDHKMSPRF